MCWDTMFVCLQLTGSNRSASGVCMYCAVCNGCMFMCVCVMAVWCLCCSSQDQYWEICSQEDECSNSNRCGSEYTSQLLLITLNIEIAA